MMPERTDVQGYIGIGLAKPFNRLSFMETLMVRSMRAKREEILDVRALLSGC